MQRKTKQLGRVLVGNCEDRDMYVRIILKCKWVERMWTTLNWVRTGIAECLFVRDSKVTGFCV